MEGYLSCDWWKKRCEFYIICAWPCERILKDLKGIHQNVKWLSLVIGIIRNLKMVVIFWQFSNSLHLAHP